MRCQDPDPYTLRSPHQHRRQGLGLHLPVGLVARNSQGGRLTMSTFRRMSSPKVKLSATLDRCRTWNFWRACEIMTIKKEPNKEAVRIYTNVARLCSTFRERAITGIQSRLDRRGVWGELTTFLSREMMLRIGHLWIRKVGSEMNMLSGAWGYRCASL